MCHVDEKDVLILDKINETDPKSAYFTQLVHPASVNAEADTEVGV